MALVRMEAYRGAVRLVLDRPTRHNSLVPSLLADFHSALVAAIAARPIAIVLTGAGRSFSTGGDLGGFQAEAADPVGLAAYADELVGALNDAILGLLACPVPIIAAVNGPVTGGSLGMVLAADLVAMADDAFIQPYYAEVGFAPDGGWTALLPERIGAARAAAILMLEPAARRVGGTSPWPCRRGRPRGRAGCDRHRLDRCARRQRAGQPFGDPAPALGRRARRRGSAPAGGRAPRLCRTGGRARDRGGHAPSDRGFRQEDRLNSGSRGGRWRPSPTWRRSGQS